MAVRRPFTQTKFFRALLVFGAALFFVWLSPQWLVRPLGATVMTVTLPLQKIYAFTAFKIEDTFNFFTSIRELKRENERLEKERLRLLVADARLAEVLTENETLRRQIDLLPRERFSLQPAEVVGQDTAGLGNWITIDRGSLAGIRQGMAVIVDAGVLIGRVTEVFPANARVMLISNPESLLSATALKTEARGIVKGEYGLGLLFDMVLQTDVLQAGDTLVSTGLKGDLPSGLVIGTLRDVRLSDDRLFQQASVVSPVRLDRLRYVFIIENTQ